jgi:CDP-paratose 2-epimerase
MKRAVKPHVRPGRTPRIGLAEWFRPGDREHAEAVLEDLKTLGVEDLRTAVCWADWYTSEGDGWYAWLLPRLARQVKILPCFVDTPPCLGIVPKTSAPPQTPKAYADFIDVMITRFGEYFDWVELWNQPNNQNQWDSRIDPDWHIFSEMIGGAAYWARERGKKTVLPGMWPADLGWIDLMCDRGVMQYIDAVSVHGFPGTSEFAWNGWDAEVQRVRERLKQHGSRAQIWITQTGFSTWRGEESAQVRALAEAMEAPVERIYWQSAYDRDPATYESSHLDQREFHLGLKRSEGTPKLLFQLWAEGGLEKVREAARRDAKPRSGARSQKHILITGGAGFIGSNLADRLLSNGRHVMVFDDLSRPGVEQNLAWLRENHGDRLRVEVADVRDRQALHGAVRGADQVFHFAAQVAVTSSLVDPIHDFEVNVRGTLNLLEEIRALESPPSVVYTSTNKVYGALPDLPLAANCTRYQPLDATARIGIDEARPLDFHSPYGCSKGAADQYVLDYARTFGLPALVFRMSCIYGLHQMGTEDQGWVAHFLIRAIEEKPIVIYGDGMQVRDLLFVDDLVDAFLLAQANSYTLAGQAFNMGGGLGNTASLLELMGIIGGIRGAKPQVRWKEWRPGDQRYYVSDTRKFKAATGWAPKVNVRQGVERLYRWLAESRGQAAERQMAASRVMYEVFAH